MDKRSCPEVRWGVSSSVKEGEHVCKGLEFDFHPSWGHLQRVGSNVVCIILDPSHCPFSPFLLGLGGSVFLPCPLKAARAADFDLNQWFTRIVFPRYLFYSFYAMFEDLILLSNVPSVVASALFQIFIVH